MYRSGTIHVSTTKSKTGWSELSGTIHVSKKNPQFVDRDGQALFIFPQKNLKLVYWNFQAMGGFPSPEITWWIGTRRLKPEKTVIVFFAMSRWVVFTRQKVTLPWHMVETRPWIKILSLIFSLFFEASEQRLCKIDHRKCICRPKQQWSRDIVEMHTTNKEIVPFGVTATM